MKDIKSEISKIIEDVKQHGDKAVTYYTYKFDNVRLPSEKFLVTQAEINEGCSKLAPFTKKALNQSARSIESFHKCELKNITKSWFYYGNGKVMGQIIKPIENAGVYIAGGKYAYYPSVVLMTVIPARIAGVKKIIVLTPPSNIVPSVLYATKIASVDTVYRIGGPQAIAACAFGTETIPKVDLVVGPGNRYVTEAKRQLFGCVGIDMLAGPSEIAVLSDETAKPDFIAFDLLAQAEHSPDSKVYLFNNSEKVLKTIKKILNYEIQHNKKKLPFLSLKKQFVIKFSELANSIDEINSIAPEHLQIIHRNASSILKKIKNVGAIFVGNYSPVAIGDYFAGPSHVLPTARTAKFSSGLSIQTFLKRTSFIKYNKESFKKISKYVCQLANTEHLFLHEKSVRIRT